MHYEAFRSVVKNLPIISWEYLNLLQGKEKIFAVQLKRWQDAGKIIRLKKGLYVLNQDERKINPSRFFIARELYSPSYISLEYALSFYGFIPEKVADITSVTSKKTASFENAFGKFVYQHLKTDCFTGFVEQKDEAELNYFIATPEKAMIDFLYLNQRLFKNNPQKGTHTADFKAVLTESLRFQNTNALNRKKLSAYAEFFKSKKLKMIVEALSKLI